VTVIELGGESPSTWSYNGSAEFNAASTYKLVAMMDEAQRIASGAVSASGNVCFQQSDWEDGWFDEYKPGACYTRQVLASRAGIQSDNTAGHMLVRDIGGTQALNAFAAAEGATASELFKDPNTTTADDLATLLSALASGRLGGAAAQAWLYPLLTHTRYEAGIPAGVPSGASVVHKTGDVDSTLDDAAIVQGGRNGAYVIVVMSDGASGWGLLASISAAVWSYEQSR
jgi:beta-lactamase class A